MIFFFIVYHCVVVVVTEGIGLRPAYSRSRSSLHDSKSSDSFRFLSDVAYSPDEEFTVSDTDGSVRFHASLSEPWSFVVSPSGVFFDHPELAASNGFFIPLFPDTDKVTSQPLVGVRDNSVLTYRPLASRDINISHFDPVLGSGSSGSVLQSRPSPSGVLSSLSSVAVKVGESSCSVLY